MNVRGIGVALGGLVLAWVILGHTQQLLYSEKVLAAIGCLMIVCFNDVWRRKE